MPKEESCELKKVSRLSEATEVNQWYSLQFPELSDLKPRVGHALISIEPGKVLVIGGGDHNGALQEIFEIDLERERDESLGTRVKEHPASTLFTAKYEFLCAKDKTDKIWMFGGADMTSTFNEVTVLQDKTLETVKCLGASLDDEKDESSQNNNSEPSSRTQGSNSAIVEFQDKEFIAVFAGGMKGEQPVDDRNLYLFDINDHKWQTVKIKMDEKLTAQHPFGCQPPIVQGHVMAAVGSKILVHGGINNITLYDGFHYIDLEEKTESTKNSLQCWTDCTINYCREKPEGRAAHGIAKISDVDRNSPIIYVFGGLGKNGACNDLWSFNFETIGWTRIKENHDEKAFAYYPTPRLDFGMCAVGSLDETTGNISAYLLIHGGMNTQGELFNDAWVMKVA